MGCLGVFVDRVLFHVTFLCFAGFGKEFIHFGDREAGKYVEMPVVDGFDECAFGRKSEGSVQE